MLEALNTTETISGFTHACYRYPAAAPPPLIRELIKELTQPGDTVLDPFIGGGTTAVEALAHGRRIVGFDINPLALAVTRAKTTPLSAKQRDALVAWAGHPHPFERTSERGASRMDRRLRNLPPHLAAFAGPAVQSLRFLPAGPARSAARLALLSAFRWAVEVTERSVSPTVIWERVERELNRLVGGLSSLIESAAASGLPASRLRAARVVRVGDAASSAGILLASGRSSSARLVLTSPPYPSVHVLYHRWQVDGRRETPAPYYLARANDGPGLSYFTLGGRSQVGEQSYFLRLQEIYSAIRPLITSDALVVQLVGFARPDDQLPRFLTAMSNAGYSEVSPTSLGWGQVPRRQVANRRWFARGRSFSAAEEVLLVHRP